jgi:hypothetical protein
MLRFFDRTVTWAFTTIGYLISAKHDDVLRPKPVLGPIHSQSLVRV